MKVNNEPRLTAGPSFLASLLDILRKYARALNGHDDDVTALMKRTADLEAANTALEARVAALETP
ncbi:hypothetical protein [Variovorax sp. DAIF25]|uniref:hypothetical protein n=1 Tax=Variovorax sp. DAIF25 TaxID=3080983 RepID=UPI003D6A1AF4